MLAQIKKLCYYHIARRTCTSIIYYILTKKTSECNKLLIKSRCGETGRRAGLKIQWANTPCRFESDQRHHVKARPKVLLFALQKSKDLPACFSFFAKISSTIFARVYICLTPPKRGVRTKVRFLSRGRQPFCLESLARFCALC